jgi:hypothetical protein
MRKLINMTKTMSLQNLSIILIIQLLFPLVIFSQNSALSDKTLKKYIPDNFTGYTILENYPLVIPYEYGKIAVAKYNPLNVIDNTTMGVGKNNNVELAILNFIKLSNDNSTILNDNQTIDSTGNICKIIQDNVTIDNFTGTLLTNNCADGVSFSLYLPLVVVNNYLLAVNVEGLNSNDLVNLINSIDLNGLSKEIQ